MSVMGELSQAIDAWVNRKPQTRTISMLSRLSNVSYSTVRRCVQGESEPSQEVALAIASVVMSDSEMRSFIGSHWPWLKRHIVDANHARGENDDDVLEFLRSQPHFRLIVIASHVDGIDSDDVVRKFGESYLDYFEDLKNAGILHNSGGKWVFDKEFGNVSRDLARTCLSHLLTVVPRQNDDIKNASSAYIAWESLNEEGNKLVSDEISDLCSRLYKIVSNQAYRGDILVACGAFHGILKGQEKLG